MYISTHNLREEADDKWVQWSNSQYIFQLTTSAKRLTALEPLTAAGIPVFQLTTSAKRLTRVELQKHRQMDISTHNLREEADAIPEKSIPFNDVISTHNLREEADQARCLLHRRWKDFNSQPPRRG